MAKTQPAKVAKTQPDVGGEEKQSPLGKIIANLLDGREQAGYTLILAKKVNGNHTVDDTGERITKDGKELALVEVK